MLTIPRCIFFLVLVNIFLISGCGGGSDSTATTNNASVVVFSDVHFNPFYDKTLLPALVAADASEWAGIFQTSRTTTPSAWSSDTNYPSLVLALSSIKQNQGTGSLVIFTGDVLGHYMPQYFYTYLNGTINPRGPEDVAAMVAFTDKTLAFVMGQVRASVGNIPVMFAVGNSDSYSGYGPTAPDSPLGPGSSFLSNSAELYYTKFLNGSVDHQTFLDTFKVGGYYSAEPAGTNLMVIGLNTIAFSPGVPGDNDNLVNTELAWLDSRLLLAKTLGKKAWLLMHVPPGADLGTTAKNAASSGHVDSTSVVMMWKPAYQASFLQILSRYPDTVNLILAGHTHMDEYRIVSPVHVVELTPGITPVFGNNPAFKVLSYSQDTFDPVDYRTMRYDLAAAPGQFASDYTFSAAYGAHGLLNASLAQLFPDLATYPAKQAFFRTAYYSGNNSLNTITDANWPIYWCGIQKMEQQELIDCVK